MEGAVRGGIVVKFRINVELLFAAIGNPYK